MAYIRPEVHKAVEENDLAAVVFQDPFGEEARKAKRNLVAASFGALLIASLQLQVSGFLGLQTATGTAVGAIVTKGLACLTVLYFLAGFSFYAFVDYSAWKFKRERYLIKPYLDLVRILENHLNNLGEQVNNATSRLRGIVVEKDMPSEVDFQIRINEAQRQLESIAKHGKDLYGEFRPLIQRWSETIQATDRLSLRLKARFASLWLLDILLPLTLACFAIWRTYDGLPAMFRSLAG